MTESMTKKEALRYLEQAKENYASADLTQALTAAQKAYHFYQTYPYDMQALDVFTLLQTIYAYLQRPNECLSLEPTIYGSIYALFPENADKLYSIHLLDLVSQLLHMEQTVSAKSYLHAALNCMKKTGTSDGQLSYLRSCFDAQISYIEEQYHTAHAYASQANTLWTSCSDSNMDAYGLQNLLLLCAINAKLGHPIESIQFLEHALEQNLFSRYQAISAESILAELYLKNDMADKALDIYRKCSSHPLVSCALSPADAQAMKYNYGLSLVNSGHYKEALPHFCELGKRGYSMRLALCSQLGDFETILALAEDAVNDSIAQIHEILDHYDEELAYTHIDELQYHINLTLDALIHAKAAPELIYTYLLNTKYISLEAVSFRGTDLPYYQARQVMQALEPNTLLLEYTVSRSLQGVNYTVFLVSCREIHVIPLGPCESIDRSICEYCTLLKAPCSHTVAVDPSDAAQWRMWNTTLRKQLYFPIREIIDSYTDLIIAPAGELIHFPFASLSSSAKGVLCDTHSIVYCNCGKELVYRRQSDNPTNHAPSFGAPLIIGSPQADSMPSLPHAEKETALVANYLQARAYTGLEADIRLLSPESIIEYDLLHIAAHGIFAPDSATPYSGQADWNSLKNQLSQSGLLFSQNELLSCEDIRKLPLENLKLAFLSCCFSGDSSYRTTEGAYGLRRSMIQAGCHCLLVNLWQIDDEISLTFTDTFYDALINQSLGPKQAFHHTILTLKDQLPPFYWAGYQFII